MLSYQKFTQMCYNVRSKYFYNEDLGQLTPVKAIYNEICK